MVDRKQQSKPTKTSPIIKRKIKLKKQIHRSQKTNKKQKVEQADNDDEEANIDDEANFSNEDNMNDEATFDTEQSDNSEGSDDSPSPSGNTSDHLSELEALNGKTIHLTDLELEDYFILKETIHNVWTSSLRSHSLKQRSEYDGSLVFKGTLPLHPTLKVLSHCVK